MDIIHIRKILGTLETYNSVQIGMNGCFITRINIYLVFQYNLHVILSWCNLLDWCRNGVRNGLPLHIQKVWQIAEVFWLTCTASPAHGQHEKLSDEIKIIWMLVQHVASTLTLISNKSTCFAFASELISEVAIEEPGWVTWKPIPETSCK